MTTGVDSTNKHPISYLIPWHTSSFAVVSTFSGFVYFQASHHFKVLYESEMAKQGFFSLSYWAAPYTTTTIQPIVNNIALGTAVLTFCTASIAANLVAKHIFQAREPEQLPNNLPTHLLSPNVAAALQTALPQMPARIEQDSTNSSNRPEGAAAAELPTSSKPGGNNISVLSDQIDEEDENAQPGAFSDEGIPSPRRGRSPSPPPRYAAASDGEMPASYDADSEPADGDSGAAATGSSYYTSSRETENDGGIGKPKRFNLITEIRNWIKAGKKRRAERAASRKAVRELGELDTLEGKGSGGFWGWLGC